MKRVKCKNCGSVLYDGEREGYIVEREINMMTGEEVRRGMCRMCGHRFDISKLEALKYQKFDKNS